jgi:putative transposase
LDSLGAVHGSQPLQRPHFVTCTVLDWLPVLARPETVGILLDAWVVPENHCHMVRQTPDLSRTLEEFKSYTAKRILACLEAQSVAG